MVHTSYLPDWRLPSSCWTILYIPAAYQICTNNVFGGILKVTECIKEFDKSLFLDSVNSFLRSQPERIWKIMIFSASSASCPFLSHSSSPSVWFWDLYFFSSEIATWEQMFPPFPEGRGFRQTKQFLSDGNTTCSVPLFAWTENPPSSDCCATFTACCGPMKHVPLHWRILILQN